MIDNFVQLKNPQLTLIYIGYWCEIQKERDHWEDENVGEWTILKYISEK
jgi:hypothetical protein